MILKIHPKDGRVLVSVCDKEFIGHVFEENGIKLDLTSDFYRGEEKTSEETGDIIRNADYVNLVGPKAVEIGLKEGVIDKEKVIYVQGIPHAQAVIEQDDQE